MKKTIICMAACFTAISAISQNFKPLNQEAMDKSVRPQDNLYDVVNGTWQKTAVIPSDKPSWGSFTELREKTDVNSLKTLNALLKKDFAKGTEGQKIKDIYATYMDIDKRNTDGLKPLAADLKKIDDIKNLNELQNYLSEMSLTGDNAFYQVRVGTDLKSSTDNAVYLSAGGLGLGRDYYQKKSDRNTEVIKEYTKYLGKLLEVLGRPTQNAEKIVAFENQMAQSFLSNEQIRDANLRYNPQTMAQLAALSKNVDLSKYLKTLNVNTDKVILTELKYYQQLDSFLNNENLDLIKDYLRVNLLSDAASVLDDNLENMRFDFYGKYLTGQKEPRSRDKRAMMMINGTLGEAFGKLYVEDYFPAASKAKMVELIDYLKKSFTKHIDNLTWMSAETKAKAQEKLNKFTVKVGYPDKWKDYSKMNISSKANGGDIYKNMQQVSKWAYEDNMAKLGKKVDKSEWGMSPQTVNAYYNPTNNEIVFPAAILQSPFFNFEADPAFNFGGIGAVIGHEMTHGFDDSGAKFDGDGNLKNWWTESDLKNFEAVTQKLADQYSGYEPVKGSFVNGKFTNGENIADLGGQNIAFDALQMFLKDKGNPGLIDGFDQKKRFFLSWATVWRTKSTDQFLQNQVKTDPHSPGYYRAIGPTVNNDAFYQSFEVKDTDKMYKTPETRIRIW